MQDYPNAAMIFAAGFGTRMGALTRTRPKALIPVAGRALIDHALTVAKDVATPVVNTHYLADQMAAHLAGHPGVTVLHEDPVLETGGGLKAAGPLLGPGPVFTLNSDAVWTGANAFEQLRAVWQPAKMDALLLLVPQTRAVGYNGAGDFTLHPDGRISKGGPLVYTGAQIIRTARLADIDEVVFSMWPLWLNLLASGRVYGTLHQGRWADVGHPDGIALAEAMLAEDADV